MEASPYPQTVATAHQERRRDARYMVPLRVYTREERAMNEKLCNISRGGLCFRSPFAFSEGDYVYLHLSTSTDHPGAGLEFSMVGKVRRVEELSASYYQYGVQHAFYDDPFSDQMRTKLERVLRSCCN